MKKRNNSQFQRLHDKLPILVICAALFFLLIIWIADDDSTTEELCEEVIRVDNRSDFAYLFLLSSNSYFPCLSVAIYSLQKTETKWDIVVLMTNNIWENIESSLKEMGVIVVRIDGIKNPNKKIKRTHLTDNYTKLRAWQLIDYRKIIYSDSDFLYVRNSDDLAYLPGDVNAGRNFASKTGEWPDENFFCAGFMVVTPSSDAFCSLIKKSSEFESATGGDQPFQNWFWAGKWNEIQYKIDAANANIFLSRREEWEADKVRSIHFTRFTNPCNQHNVEFVSEFFNNFEENYAAGNPLGLWLHTKNNLLLEYPQFVPLFEECGFLKGWTDTGKAAATQVYHPIGFV